MATKISGNSISVGNSVFNESGLASVVKQIVYGEFSFVTSGTTSTSFVDSGASVDITPTDAASKILVCNSFTHYATNGNNGIALRCKRDIGGTLAYVGDLPSPAHNLKMYINGGSNINYHTTVASQYLDDPNTTSQITYTMQFASYVSGSFVSFGNQYPHNLGSLWVMEIETT